MLTEQALREDIHAGLPPSQIAAKHNISTDAVRMRIRRMRIKAEGEQLPDEVRERYTSRQFDVMEELMLAHERARKLQNACDRWLTDPEDPDDYNIGARANETRIIYETEDQYGNSHRHVATLAELLARIDPSIKVRNSTPTSADPRTLLLKTMGQMRATAVTLATVLQGVARSHSNDRFRKAVISQLAKSSPETADAIKRAVQECASHRDYREDTGRDTNASEPEPISE